jgi:hypothetical protein
MLPGSLTSKSWCAAPALVTALADFVDPYVDPDSGLLRNLIGATSRGVLDNVDIRNRHRFDGEFFIAASRLELAAGLIFGPPSRQLRFTATHQVRSSGSHGTFSCPVRSILAPSTIGAAGTQHLPTSVFLQDTRSMSRGRSILL